MPSLFCFLQDVALLFNWVVVDLEFIGYDRRDSEACNYEIRSIRKTYGIWLCSN